MTRLKDAVDGLTYIIDDCNDVLGHKRPWNNSKPVELTYYRDMLKVVQDGLRAIEESSEAAAQTH